jgi:WD40 repeat protein
VLVSAGRDKRIIIWELGEGGKAAQKHILEGHSVTVNSISLTPEGTHLASGSFDGTVRIWEVATGQQVRVLNGHSGICVKHVEWSPDGKYIVSGDFNSTSCVWKAANVQVRGRMYRYIHTYIHTYTHKRMLMLMFSRFLS